MKKKCKFAQQNILFMIAKEIQIKENNPWRKVANDIDPNDEKCLYDTKNTYVVKDDEDRISKFNDGLKHDDEGKIIDDDRIILETPPEPWRGNPLSANLIILSLNPGYDPNINEILAKLIQSNKSVRRDLVTFRRDTLCLNAKSFLPEEKGNGPITCEEAEDMLSGWYWTKRLNTLQDELFKEIGLSKEEFYRKVAVIEFHGYSSKTSTKGFPFENKSNPLLKSQEFTRDLIDYISNRADVCFLIMRSKEKWEKQLLSNIWETLENKQKLIYKKNQTGRSCQYVTPNNLEKCFFDNGHIGNGYYKIKDLFIKLYSNKSVCPKTS